MVMVDDFTRRITTYLLKHKDDAAEKIKRYMRYKSTENRQETEDSTYR